MAKKIPYAASKNTQSAQVPILHLTRKDPKLAAAISKVVQGIDPVRRDGHGNRRPVVEDVSIFHEALSKRARRNNDSQAVLKMMPDIELSAQILISSILSPKDMAAAELSYTLPKDLFGADLTAALTDLLKTTFEEDFNINNTLSDILEKVLFKKGSYPVAVIPENAIDEMINGSRNISTEELQAVIDKDYKPIPVGLLGGYEDAEESVKPNTALESLFKQKQVENKDNHLLHYYLKGDSTFGNKYAAEEYVWVTDNPAVLRLSELKDKLRKQGVVGAYHRNGLKNALEAHSPISDFRVEQAIMRPRGTQAERTAVVPHQYELKRKSVGNPLIMELPSESVIPVHTPGNPKQHVGYFIALDEEGNPLEMADGDYLHPSLKRSGNGAIMSNLMQRVKSNMTETDASNPYTQLHVKTAFRIYADLVERDLISRIKNGRSAASVAVARNEEVYRLMLSRTMAQRYTQLLYVPVEYMTYIAFIYGEDGIGQSLLDQQSMLSTLRSVLLFSDIMASVKNSIARTKVTMTVDEADPNPMARIEQAMDEIVRSRTVMLPMGVSAPADIMNFIQSSGYLWDIQGQGLPDTKFEFEQQNSNFAKPDPDLQERLRKASIQGFGLSPEVVDNGFNAEFATTAVANNILLAKRVIVWQDEFTPQLTSHLRKIAINTESIVTAVKDLLEKNVEKINLKLEDIDGVKETMVDEVSRQNYEKSKETLIVSHALHLLLNGFKVTLPRPSSVTIKTQQDDLTNYAAMLEVALDAYMASEVFCESIVGKLASAGPAIKGLFKAYFLRKWMAEKNILPELSILAGKDDMNDVDEGIVGDITRHMENISRISVKSLVELTSNVKATNTDMARAGIDETTLAATGSMGSTSSDFSSTGDGLGGFDMGGDDFGLGGSGDLDSTTAVDGTANALSNSDGSMPSETPSETPDNITNDDNTKL